MTEYLFMDLQHAFIDSCIDPLPSNSLDALTIEAIKRDGRREFVDLILEWVPNGCTKEGEEDA